MKVGEYARLNSTLYNTVVILKIMEVYDYTILTENDGSIFQGEYGKDEIINHSYNIIDLIEVGDYVNGRKVFQAGYNFQDDYVLKMSESDYEDFIYKKDIKSIVTKEMFENMEYKI